MKTLWFTLGLAELVASPAILAIYGLIALFATMGSAPKPVLDFSVGVR